MIQSSLIAQGRDARFSGALLKVASRCNLDCDNCYVYKHPDQSWRHQPVFMDDRTIQTFAERLEDYVGAYNLTEFSIVFHGGEPMLYTAKRLAAAAECIRRRVRSSCTLYFSLQTNGVLLSDSELDVLAQAQISVSLSLDGPRHVHDRHRPTHSGDSTFDATISALKRLQLREEGLFRGVIAVIDPQVPPSELLAFFASLNLPSLDLLLPDATHIDQPMGRSEDPKLYRRWLEEAFKCWFHTYPDLPIRWFDAILASRLGVPSPTDIMGFGAVGLIVIETDGSYTDHDVFKITQPGGALLNQMVTTTSLDEIARHPHIHEHSYRLSMAGIAPECRSCPVVAACGGGCVMHRYHPTRGLNAPTVYCQEMFGILHVATSLLQQELRDEHQELSLADSTAVIPQGEALVKACQHWRAQTERQADMIASEQGWHRNDAPAAAVLLRASTASGSDTELLSMGAVKHIWLASIRVQSLEPWLVRPFADTIRLLPPASSEVMHGINALDTVERYLALVDSALPAAIAALISDVLFVETTVPDEGGIFSFSDDTAPNVLYLAPYAGGAPLAFEDLADSIVHEFYHQQLYHMERDGVFLFDHVFLQFPAPWREGLRPAGGFFHGTFVFAGLARFWAALADAQPVGLDLAKAQQNAARCRAQASYGIASLRDFALLTERGERLLNELARQLKEDIPPSRPPGIL